jgi:hypothetical protein
MDDPHAARRIVSVRRLHDPDDVPAARTPAENVAMVWPLTLQVWAFTDARFDAQSRLPRHIVCVRKRRR